MSEKVSIHLQTSPELREAFKMHCFLSGSVVNRELNKLMQNCVDNNPKLKKIATTDNDSNLKQ